MTAAAESIEVEEWYCRGCGWTEPVFQEGDPALCSNCYVEYEPAFVFGFGGDGWQPPTRTRTWPRCAGWNDDGSKCDKRTSEEYCHHHADPGGVGEK